MDPGRSGGLNWERTDQWEFWENWGVPPGDPADAGDLGVPLHFFDRRVWSQNEQAGCQVGLSAAEPPKQKVQEHQM